MNNQVDIMKFRCATCGFTYYVSTPYAPMSTLEDCPHCGETEMHQIVSLETIYLERP